MKLKNREALAEHFAELGFKVGAEVGVCYGAFSEKLYKHMPDLTLFAVDSWDNAETRRRERVHSRNVEWFFRNRMANNRPIVIKMFSTDAAKYIADGSLDFVYIDAAHDYENVKLDINAWAPKVRKGGIVSGDDYYPFPSGSTGVVDAVNEYVKEHGIKLEVTEWDNDNPERDERQPAWWFTK